MAPDAPLVSSKIPRGMGSKVTKLNIKDHIDVYRSLCWCTESRSIFR